MADKSADRETDTAAIRIEAAACPTCGGSPPEEIVTHLVDVEDRVDGTYDIGRCPRCRLIYLCLRPSPESLQQCYPVDYHVHDVTRQGFLPRMIYGLRSRLRRRRVVAATHGRFASLLEVGCGDAALLRHFDRTCPPAIRLTGIDLQAREIDQGRLRVTSGDFENADIDGTYDAVVMFNVLEHLPNPVGSLRKIRDRMPPGGVLYGEVPDWNSIWRRLFPRHWQGLQIPRHMTHFERATLQHVLECAGFEDVRIHGLFDPGDLGVTLCNWMADQLRLATPPRRAWFFLPVVLTTAPIAWLICFLAGNASSLEFKASRRA